MESNYQKLQVWQKAMELVKIIYEVTKKFPKEEVYGLTSQVRQCAIIPEGNQRSTKKDFIHFLIIAKGFAALEMQLILAQNLGYIQKEVVFQKCKNDALEVKKMLSGLISSLRTPHS